MASAQLDLGLIAEFQAPGQINPAKLVRFARDHGFRGLNLSSPDPALQEKFAQAAKTFSLTLVSAPSQPLPADPVAAILQARSKQKNAAFAISLNASGQVSKADLTILARLNQWLHDYGHAFYESRPTAIKASAPNLIFQNGHAPYQIYLFIKNLSAGKLSITNLPTSVNKIESIAKRTSVPFKQEGKKAVLTLPNSSDSAWRGFRILLHRPEDDIKKTKY